MLRPLGKKTTQDLLLDVLVGAGWLAWASLSIETAIKTGGPIDWGLQLFFLLLVVLFVLRSHAQKAAAVWESLLAYGGTVLPVVMLKPGGNGLVLVGEALQLLGLLGMLAAAVSLGRSFGVAPADRGLRSTGSYRIVRHPLYAMEICFYAGYVIANPTVRNAIGLVLLVAVQIIRIGREERMIDGYAAYAQRVRYRLIPFVW
jgi:protein-S-isoprenylcysteine O-methyltransferase Ste14